MSLKKWDHNSGVRERLALLAALGPVFEPVDWGYNSNRDVWYYCGPNRRQKGRTIKVAQEGSGSLGIIAVKYLIERKEAMDLIGYGEPK